MKYFEIIVKNPMFQRTIDEIQQISTTGTYIFSNSDSEYLKEFIKCVAIAFYCLDKKQKPCFKCSNCIKSLSGGNLDLVEYNEPEIKVEIIEDIIDKASLFSRGKLRRTFLIPDAKNINIVAQNKLLKTLEEQETDAIFLMGCTNLNAVLDTIKSRCKIITLPPCTKDEIKQILKIEDNNPEGNFAIDFANGSPTLALQMCEDEKYFRIYQNIIKILKEMKKSSDVLTYINYIKDDTKEIEIFFFLFEKILHNILHAELGKNENKEFKEIAKEYNHDVISNIQNLIIKSHGQIACNMKRETVLETFFYSMLEVKAQCQNK